MQPLLTFRGVYKTFGDLEVVSGLNLELFAGESVLLLGANGAGKTTALRVASGLARADAGSIEHRSNSTIGFSGHHSFLYHQLTVEENLVLFAKLAGCTEHIKEILKEWGLEPFSKKRISQLSKGYQARVSLSRAFMFNPNILLLDEPTSALDTSGVEILLSNLAKLKQRLEGDLLVVCATHDIHRISSIASRVIVIDSGKVRVDSKDGDNGAGIGVEKAIQDYLEVNR